MTTTMSTATCSQICLPDDDYHTIDELDPEERWYALHDGWVS